ncbi:MAG: TQO small subunit DoxD, partial [Ktedonobacterales bacterium]
APSSSSQVSGWLEAARRRSLPAWVLLPLRLFLGVTFVYAGLQKLTDPQYFQPSARGYIGKQIAAFANGTPLHNLLLSTLPHAQVFGALIAFGELAIGLGTLVGLLLRPAAFFGALLSLIFFLSASWRVYPYFYGADIVFLFGWITILIAGPTAGGWPALDASVAEWALAQAAPERRHTLAGVLAFVLGVPPHRGAPESAANGSATSPSGMVARGARQQPVRGVRGSAYARAQSRRDFLRGTLSGAAGMLGLVAVFALFRRGGDSAPTGTGGTSGSGAFPAGTAAPGGANVIAQVSQVPQNSAATFTLPSNGDPGVVVHLNNDKFVAFDATCTHAGCPVQYNPQDQLLECPCHGAAFDPAQNAAPVQGPTNTPLTPVNIQVNSSTGAITLAS